jgi:hypothetical protein
MRQRDPRAPSPASRRPRRTGRWLVLLSLASELAAGGAGVVAFRAGLLGSVELETLPREPVERVAVPPVDVGILDVAGRDCPGADSAAEGALAPRRRGASSPPRRAPTPPDATRAFSPWIPPWGLPVVSLAPWPPPHRSAVLLWALRSWLARFSTPASVASSWSATTYWTISRTSKSRCRERARSPCRPRTRPAPLRSRAGRTRYD